MFSFFDRERLPLANLPSARPSATLCRGDRRHGIDIDAARTHHAAMRRWLSAAVVVAVALAGCVIVPGRQHALVLEADGTVAQRQMSCGDRAGASAATVGALDPRSIRIASWNVHKQSDPGWGAELGGLIAANDVLLLQEAGVDRELRDAIERGGLSWVLASAFEYLGAEYGVLTATRVQPAGACTLRAYEPLLGIPKAALITRFRLEGRDTTLAIANLHTINFTPGTAAYRAQLDAIGDTLAAHRGPVVLAGDFNTWNDARLEALRDVTSRLSLVPVAFAVDERQRFLGRIFDWIYVRGVEVIDATAWAVTSSDHNPLAVTLRIR
jgi:endonuclease/exonuclease/phosphatase (EEP) superfamily protein YafD